MQSVHMMRTGRGSHHKRTKTEEAAAHTCVGQQLIIHRLRILWAVGSWDLGIVVHASTHTNTSSTRSSTGNRDGVHVRGSAGIALHMLCDRPGVCGGSGGRAWCRLEPLDRQDGALVVRGCEAAGERVVRSRIHRLSTRPIHTHADTPTTTRHRLQLVHDSSRRVCNCCHGCFRIVQVSVFHATAGTSVQNVWGQLYLRRATATAGTSVQHVWGQFHLERTTATVLMLRRL